MFVCVFVFCVSMCVLVCIGMCVCVCVCICEYVCGRARSPVIRNKWMNRSYQHAYNFIPFPKFCNSLARSSKALWVNVSSKQRTKRKRNLHAAKLKKIVIEYNKINAIPSSIPNRSEHH